MKDRSIVHDLENYQLPSKLQMTCEFSFSKDKYERVLKRTQYRNIFGDGESS